MSFDELRRKEPNAEGCGGEFGVTWRGEITVIFGAESLERGDRILAKEGGVLKESPELTSEMLSSFEPLSDSSLRLRRKPRPGKLLPRGRLAESAAFTRGTKKSFSRPGEGI